MKQQESQNEFKNIEKGFIEYVKNLQEYSKHEFIFRKNEFTFITLSLMFKFSICDYNFKVDFHYYRNSEFKLYCENVSDGNIYTLLQLLKAKIKHIETEYKALIGPVNEFANYLERYLHVKSNA